MKILITGGTGFIGSALIKNLSPYPHDLVLLTRSASKMELRGALTVKYVQWDARTSGGWEKEITGCDCVINLIGKNLFEERWNAKVKQEILSSRITPTALVVDALGRMEHKPGVFISASAVGYYGDRHDETITEESAGGNDFLADVVLQWERAAYRAEQFGIRVVTPRIGLVLERTGGMIGKMLLPFQLFAGGPIGTGKQFLPWIHMDDVIKGILYPIENEQCTGIYNLVSPNPVTMKEFSKTFGSVLHRPSWLPVPNLALQLLYGEGAKAILSGQKVLPKKLLSSGYEFSFPDLRTALTDVMTQK